MQEDDSSRRSFIRNASLLAGSAFVLGACGTTGDKIPSAGTKKEEGTGEKEVSAVEDLMREHGVLRRALIVYSESASLLRKDAAEVAPEALRKTAKLFRTFGEEYHEKQLEEAHIFPSVKRNGGKAADLTDILIVQHNRGQEITDYISSVANAAKIGANAGALADALDSFVRMYRTHAAREDTVVFPAWKNAITDSEYEELGEKFEEIEHKTFGRDGFEDAVKQISEIESSLKLTDIAQFTAAGPPKMG